MAGLCLASQVRGDCGLTARTSPRVDDESPRQGSDALAYIFAAPARHGDDRPPTATDPVTTVTDGDKPAFRSDAKQSMCLHTSLSRDDRLALGGCTASIEVGFIYILCTLHFQFPIGTLRLPTCISAVVLFRPWEQRHSVAPLRAGNALCTERSMRWK